MAEETRELAVKPWATARDARGFGPGCMRSALQSRGSSRLNVFTPAHVTSKPVLVWYGSFAALCCGDLCDSTSSSSAATTGHVLGALVHDGGNGMSDKGVSRRLSPHGEQRLELFHRAVPRVYSRKARSRGGVGCTNKTSAADVKQLMSDFLTDIHAVYPLASMLHLSQCGRY